jgi:hypothetical protein
MEASVVWWVRQLAIQAYVCHHVCRNQEEEKLQPGPKGMLLLWN